MTMPGETMEGDLDRCPWCDAPARMYRRRHGLRRCVVRCGSGYMDCPIPPIYAFTMKGAMMTWNSECHEGRICHDIIQRKLMADVEKAKMKEAKE